jgi:RNA polymerase sigma-70 factor (ECF subfamily)
MEHPAPASVLRELTSGLARGDDAAWAQFHREHGPGIFRSLLAATRGDHDLASEALQQTYLRVARYAKPCDSAPMFAGWLRVVARTALSDCRRRRMSFWQMLRRRHEDPSGKERSEETEDSQLQAALESALGLLAGEDRTLLEAKYFSGESVKAIADRLVLSPKAVESRLTRARSELRRHILTALARHE